MKNSII